MRYNNSTNFKTDSSEVRKFIVSIFSQLGFRIDDKGQRELELTGPGLRNTRQSPLLGFSKLNIQLTPHEIHVTGELGGVAWMRNFLIWFIGGMLLFFVVLFGILFRNNPNFDNWIVVLPFAPWPFLIPWISRLMEKRSRTAMDNLLHNLSAM
ncbi:MAG: hypothetical protein CMO80_19115 [Verrucomicrobiales bacterium]|nr:hypothetical protein [Verrucomicrobiales bacterium]|tara:strand:- start:52 stop:507 length:456 start_codon:yes stop_codon:yes gene_type:complete